MSEINLLYSPKIYTVKISKKNHTFYSRIEFEKFIDKIDLSKYDFIAGCE